LLAFNNWLTPIPKSVLLLVYIIDADKWTAEMAEEILALASSNVKVVKDWGNVD